MQHKVKIKGKPKQIKMTVKPITAIRVNDDRPMYTDSDGRAFDRFDQTKPIEYEA